MSFQLQDVQAQRDSPSFVLGAPQEPNYAQGSLLPLSARVSPEAAKHSFSEG